MQHTTPCAARCSPLPAHQGRDDDTPCCTAAVCVEVLFALSVAAAQPEGVEQEEEQVQSQAGERHATQQQQGLRKRKPVVSMGPPSSHSAGHQLGPRGRRTQL